MSIWHKEIIKVNSKVYAYVEIQNDWTGQITASLRNVRFDTELNYPYCMAEGNKISLIDEFRHYKESESLRKTAIEFFDANRYKPECWTYLQKGDFNND